MIEPDVLIEEKHQLIRDLDHKKYTSEALKEVDLQRLSKVTEIIREKAYQHLKQQEKVIAKIVTDKSEIVEMQHIRKIMNDKYDKIVELRRKTNNLLDHYRKKAEEGRSFKDKLKGLNPTDDIPKNLKPLVDDILKW